MTEENTQDGSNRLYQGAKIHRIGLFTRYYCATRSQRRVSVRNEPQPRIHAGKLKLHQNYSKITLS